MLIIRMIAMRTLLLLIASLYLTSTAYAHSSLIPHVETESELLHSLSHTALSIVLAVIFYLLVRKVFAPKRLSFKRHRD